VSLRVAGHEAAFHFRLTVTAGDNKIRIEPIDVMVFDDRGKISAMKAYWSAADATQL
jgi:steroid Delta-isomerase